MTCLSANETARQVWRESGEAEQRRTKEVFEGWRRAPVAREVWCSKVFQINGSSTKFGVETVRVVTAGES